MKLILLSVVAAILCSSCAAPRSAGPKPDIAPARVSNQQTERKISDTRKSITRTREKISRTKENIDEAQVRSKEGVDHLRAADAALEKLEREK